MRGSPLLRALLAFVAILCLGFPLWHLTSVSEAEAVVAPPPAPATEQEIGLQLTFSTNPKNVRVLHLGRAVWNETAPTAEMERKLRLVFPREGVDLQFQAEFPEGTTRAALRVQLTDPAGNESDKTLWGTGSIDDVLSFP